VLKRRHHDLVRDVRRAARWTLGLFLAVLTGSWGALALFSDVLMRFSSAESIALVAVTHFIPAVIIGALLRSRWYVALLAAWGGLAIDGMGYVMYLLRGVGAAKFYVGAPILGFFVIPSAVLLGGLVGSRTAGGVSGLHPSA
jgi:hypothetical protein